MVWYQGNPVATQQVFGSTLDPLQINGIWKDRYLGTDAAITLIETFENLVRTGVLVRVLWGTREREGVISKFRFMPGNPTGGIGDSAWEMEIASRSDGAVPPPKIIQPAPLSLRDGLVQIATSFGTIRTKFQQYLGLKQPSEIPDPTTFLGDSIGTAFGGVVLSLEGIVQTVQAILQKSDPTLQGLNTAAAQVGNSVQLPLSIAQSSTAAIADTAAAITALAEQLEMVFPSSASTTDSEDVILLQAVDRATLIEECWDSLIDLFEQWILLEATIRPEVVKSVPAQAGRDLRSYALSYYGDSDLWDRLAAANGFETSVIPDGIAEILIPETLPAALQDQGSQNG
jgi:hypothetical protein